MTELEDRIPIFKFAITFTTALTAGANLYISRVIGNAMIHSTAPDAIHLFQIIADHSQRCALSRQQPITSIHFFSLAAKLNSVRFCRFMTSISIPSIFGALGLAVLTGNTYWVVPATALAAIFPINAFFISKPAEVLHSTEIKDIQEGDKRIGDAVVSWCNWQQYRTAASLLALVATLYLLAFTT